MAGGWPLELVDEELRRFQECGVDMLVVNGTVDFSTPPTALDELRPYYANAQTVLLPEFSHVGDVIRLQPEGFKRLITSYYDSGVADAVLFEYQPIPFKPQMSMTIMAKLLVAAMVVLPPLLIAVLVIILRRVRRSKSIGKQ